MWYATKDANGGIDLITEAYEIPNGMLNRMVGALVGSNRDQRALWNTFLRNIDAKEFGGQGQILPMQEEKTPEMINPLAAPLGCSTACSTQPWTSGPPAQPDNGPFDSQ